MRRGAMTGKSLALPLLWGSAAAQLEWFDVTQYRGPAQCERMQCLSVRLDYCRDHLYGFSLKEKGCPAGQQCTNCHHGNSTVPSMCYCENPPYSTSVTYNQRCGPGMECSEGFCFRPCHTFLQVTSCPTGPEGHCAWDSVTKMCHDRVAAPEQYEWVEAQDGTPRTASVESLDIVQDTSIKVFPMGFDYFRKSAIGFRIHGMLMDDITSFESVFQGMDKNVDGFLSHGEFNRLPEVLTKLEAQAAAFSVQKEQDADAQANARRLNIVFNQTATPESCSSKRPRQYFCSFDVSCKMDCRECGWKTATDTAFATCVRPTPETCSVDGGKTFCESDQLCHEPGDCSNCADRPIVDHVLNQCLALWWSPKPLETMQNWVCRLRNKNGMSCNADQDCVHGLRRCISGKCMSFQPYNVNHTCVSDLDCPHKGFYCPSDPTGGANKYWIQYCREQGDEMMTCQADRECKPDLRCNVAESPGRCRRLFSVPIGGVASQDELCAFGWRDVNFKCAPAAKSKNVGRPCDTHEDCDTTDISGRSGECKCKAWWERSDPKYCNPVAGDYVNHQERLRNYIAYRAENCGAFWSEDECLRVGGTKAKRLKLEVECETSKLVGGPFLPGADCGMKDYSRFPDPCAELEALKR